MFDISSTVGEIAINGILGMVFWWLFGMMALSIDAVRKKRDAILLVKKNHEQLQALIKKDAAFKEFMKHLETITPEAIRREALH
jgi:hypothetical protein